MTAKPTSYRANGIWLVIHFVLLMLFAGLAFLWGTPQFLANDDLAMKWLSEGNYSGVPESNLVFVHKAIGIVAVLASEAAPAVAWYSLFLWSSSFIAIFSLGIIIRNGNSLSKAYATIISIPAVVFVTQNPNFTVTAILASGAGLLVLTQRKGSLWTLVGGTTLILLGILWRSDALIVALISGATVVIYAIFVKNKILWLLAATALILAAMAIFNTPQVQCFGLNQTVCTEWAEYETYNAARGALHGNLRAELIFPFAGSEISWTPDAARSFSNFSSFDGEAFSKDKIITANSLVPNFLELKGGSAYEHMSYLYGLLKPYSLIYVALLVSTILAAWIVQGRPSRWLVLKWSGIMLSTGASLLAVSLVRLPDAIIVGVTVFFGFQLATTLSDLRQREIVRVGWTMTAYASMGVMIWGAWLVSPSGFQHKKEENERLNSLSVELAQSLEQISYGALVSHGRNSPLFNNEPYSVSRSIRTNGMPLFTGWPALSPAWQAKKTNLGIQPDVYTSLFRSGVTTKNSSEEVFFLGDDGEASQMASLMQNQLGFPGPVIPIKFKDAELGLSLWFFFTPASS